ncbi:MAG: hypothetical protein ACM3PC_11410 [Deltaproteobacteria bacterium]
MLRRTVCAVALVSLASTPVVARTRLFCRYTGIEITDCAEQGPGDSVVQMEGCCDRQISRPLGVLLQGHDHQIAPPALHLLPALSNDDSPPRTSPAQRARSCASPTGPPVYVITRALLI